MTVDGHASPAAPVANPATGFRHLHAAHCESGVMAALLTHHGLPLSEPMAFGLGAGLAFAVIPFVRIAGMPLVAYRMPPRSIIRGLARRLGLRIRYQTFRNPERGMRALDERIDAGGLVGLQTSVYWLPYFPDSMRFHFNAHNLIVYGRSGDEYWISDPVFEEPVTCDRASLVRARFARGALAARGLMYEPTRVPAQIDVDRSLKGALRSTLRTMTGSPLPQIGVRGIRHLGRRLARLERSSDRRPLERFLVHVVRMQEEIGTGGAGFRFLYASFLEEASRRVESETLAEASRCMTDAGDTWRRFAHSATKMAKRREPLDVSALIDLLDRCARAEAEVWTQVGRFV